MENPTLDISDIGEEFKKLTIELDSLKRKFIAIALDYGHYVDNSWGQSEIYQLRDSVAYRFFSTRLHTELLIRQHFLVDSRFNELLKKNPKDVLGSYFPSNPHFDRAQEEISSIFDSFLYHQVSVFDYLGTLVNYVCGPKGNKQGSLKWTSLARSARDSKNHFGSKEIATIIKDLDSQFVNKLYHYRSILIHEKAEKSNYSVNVSLGTESKVTAQFIASEQLIKQFFELKKLADTKRLTIKYVAFWIMRKSISSVIDVLYALKVEMEQNPQIPFGMMGYLDKQTNRMLPASTPWWMDSDKN